MSKVTEYTPDDEQNYLKNNALLSLAMGALFTSDIWEHIFVSLDQSIGGSVSLIAGIATIIVVLVFLSKVCKGSMSNNKRAFWLGNFQDEYLNHTNLKGYKWAFNLGLAFLFFTHLFVDMMEVEFTVSAYARFVVGVLFLAYAVPVLYLLRDNDE